MQFGHGYRKCMYASVCVCVSWRGLGKYESSPVHTQPLWSLLNDPWPEDAHAREREMVGGRCRKERSGRRKAPGRVTRSKMDKNCSKMKRSERCKRGLSDESDSCFLAEMCPDMTTVGSFHQGLSVKGRRKGGGRIDWLYRGGHGRCMWYTQTLQFISFYSIFLKFPTLLLFHLALQLRLCVCLCACINVRVRALADLPCEQWHRYALLIANQWALWDVWDALKSPTRHILVCQHIHEH